MFYERRQRPASLRHDPFKALVAPRPIGWIGTVSRGGVPNLAPYSFFNAVCDRPPMVMFSSSGRKDSQRNAEETGEFTCSIATWALRDAMNLSSATVRPDVDEFALAGLDAAPGTLVRAPRVAQSPAALECRYWRTLELPADAAKPGEATALVFGEVIGVYIDDAYVRDGMVDTGAMRPLARMGYMQYGVITPDTVFTLNRPAVSEDGRHATVDGRAWDGVYR